jgi:hypothetical protein
MCILRRLEAETRKDISDVCSLALLGSATKMVVFTKVELIMVSVNIYT